MQVRILLVHEIDRVRAVDRVDKVKITQDCLYLGHAPGGQLPVEDDVQAVDGKLHGLQSHVPDPGEV